MLPNLLMFVDAANVMLPSRSGAENVDVSGCIMKPLHPRTTVRLHHASNETNRLTGWGAQPFCLLTNLSSTRLWLLSPAVGCWCG